MSAKCTNWPVLTGGEGAWPDFAESGSGAGIYYRDGEKRHSKQLSLGFNDLERDYWRIGNDTNLGALISTLAIDVM